MIIINYIWRGEVMLLDFRIGSKMCFEWLSVIQKNIGSITRDYVHIDQESVPVEQTVSPHKTLKFSVIQKNQVKILTDMHTKVVPIHTNLF